MAGTVENDELGIGNVLGKKLTLIGNFFVLVSPENGGRNRDFFEKRSEILVDDFFEERTVLRRGVVVVGRGNLFDKEV